MIHTQATVNALIIVAVVTLAFVLLIGCSINGHPMRTAGAVSAAGDRTPPGKAWFIEGKAQHGTPFSCSFVEFDERGDFLEFNQHLDCQRKIRGLVNEGKVLVVIYCHGWKNSSQSGDVVQFNSFLSKLADSDEIRKLGMRVHGVYLGWRGNLFRPFVDRNTDGYREVTQAFDGTIVDENSTRRFYWAGMIPENLSYWNRKGAAEDKVSGLPMARAIFTYAAAGKGYGGNLQNRVCVMGHSFGALMLERSLGQAMTGELTLEWWDKIKETRDFHKPSLPFDLVLFVNSAAPAIYAKEMRDFLKADRSAREQGHIPTPDVPVIVSLTSTADWATGVVHPIGNLLAPLQPSLKRRYTTGIFGGKQTNYVYPTHKGIRQSEFYNKTPGHQPYLINHWIIRDSTPLPAKLDSGSIFSTNLSTAVADPDIFFTSQAKYPAAAWRITTEPQGTPVTLDGLSPSMPDSNYWIISCGRELIGGHNDVWSTTTMEMYAALFRGVESRRSHHN